MQKNDKKFLHTENGIYCAVFVLTASTLWI